MLTENVVQQIQCQYRQGPTPHPFSAILDSAGELRKLFESTLPGQRVGEESRAGAVQSDTKQKKVN